jgi:hypothetical protein
MQYIGKDNNVYKKRGYEIVDSFISDCWQSDSNRYVNLGYDELKRKENFKDLLLEEQKGFCCYCMRKIPVNKLTLEHVMPRNIKTDIKNEVEHYYQFVSPQKVKYIPQIIPDNKLKYPPYPHCIAYENLTASCDGSIWDGNGKHILHGCCNNKRGNDKIIPLFFLPRIHYLLIYEEDGRLTYAEEYDSTIKSLNLDCNSLRLIRKVWACIRNSNIKIADVRAAEEDKILRIDIIVRLGLDRKDESTIKNDTYWKLLLQFYWFYGYFGLKYTV